MGRPIGLIAALIVGFCIFLLSTVTPKPVPADAPASDFSAMRAMTDIRAMGSVPHALGSPANDQVRAYLVSRMQSLGLSPQVQHGSAFEARAPFIGGGSIDNVIGILPGHDRSAPALALMAHHDSVAGSPGAADDTAGVASALEMVRAIKTKGMPDRDVMLVITDGEEAGLLGARAFFEDSPLAAHVGYIINMETRGGGGRTQMFETAPDNGGDVALFRRTADRPQSNALTVFVYKHMQNDTDFTVAKAHGKVGLNYAFIGRQFDYHSPSSTPDALDVGALQHMGAQILPTAEALAFGALPARKPDVIYGNILGPLTPEYPVWGGWIVLLAATSLIALGARRAYKRSELAFADIARGAGASLYIMLAGVAVLELVRRETGVGAGWMAYRPILARFPLFELMMLAAALGVVIAAASFSNRAKSRWIASGAALVAGAACSLFGGFDAIGLGAGVAAALAGAASFGAPGRTSGTWTGLMIIALILATVGQALAPTAAYVLAWPLLAAAIASGVSGAGAARRSLPQLAVAIVAALTFAWVGSLFHSLLQALDMAALPAFAAWLGALMIWPLATSENPERASLWPAGILVTLSLALAAFLHLASPWTPRHPNSVEPVYVVDPAAHQGWRASFVTPDAWTRDVLTAEGGAIGILPSIAFGGDPAAPAAPVSAEPAPVTALAGPYGQVTITAAMHSGASRLIVAFRAPTGITDVRVNGKPANGELTKSAMGGSSTPPTFNLKPGQWGKVLWAAPEGYTLTFTTADPSKVEIETAEGFDRWMSAKPLPPMPASDQAWDRSGSSLVLGTAIVTSKAPGS